MTDESKVVDMCNGLSNMVIISNDKVKFLVDEFTIALNSKFWNVLIRERRTSKSEDNKGDIEVPYASTCVHWVLIHIYYWITDDNDNSVLSPITPEIYKLCHVWDVTYIDSVFDYVALAMKKEPNKVDDFIISDDMFKNPIIIITLFDLCKEKNLFVKNHTFNKIMQSVLLTMMKYTRGLDKSYKHEILVERVKINAIYEAINVHFKTKLIVDNWDTLLDNY